MILKKVDKLLIILIFTQKDTKTKKVTNSYTGGEKRFKFKFQSQNYFSGLAVENNDANEIMTKASKKK